MMTNGIQRKVIGFYGFKGGAGRSLLLVNLAVAMASQGNRVLVMDCDLEAPGLGDYLDSGTEAFASWRDKKGVLDLMSDPEQYFIAEGAAGEQPIDAFSGAGALSPDNVNGCLTRIPVVHEGGGSIYLLGPGSHKATVPYPQRYTSKVVDFDWGVLVSADDGRLLSGFGEALQNQRAFDFVLIDARTGYNLASVAILQNWATDVVAVGTMSLQSIDGLARMMPVFADVKIVCHLAISKAPFDIGVDDTSMLSDEIASITETEIKEELIKRWYHHQLGANIYWFPFLESLKYGDNDLWSRYSPEVMGRKDVQEKTVEDLEQGAQLKDREYRLVREYAAEVYRLFSRIAGTPQLPEKRVAQTFHAKARTSRALANKAKGSESIPRKADVDMQIDLFLKRVEEFCHPVASDKSLSQPLPGSGQSETRLPEVDPPPSLVDNEMRDLPLAARDLARVKVAALLNQLPRKSDAYDLTRIYKVKELNGLFLLPVSEFDMPALDVEGDVPAKRNEVDPAVATWAAFGRAVRTPSEIDNKKRLEEARVGLTMRVPDREMLREALALAELVVNACGDAVEDVEMALLELGRALIGALKGQGLGAGDSTKSLMGKWNVLDAFVPYASRVMARIASAESDQLRDQLDQIQSIVLHYLKGIQFHDKFDARQELGLSFWGDYLRTTLLARRSVWTSREVLRNSAADFYKGAPHSRTAVLSKVEAAELLNCLSPDERTETVEESVAGGRSEYERVTRFRVHIEICALCGAMEEATQALQLLAQSLSDRREFQELARDNSSGEVARRDIAKWAFLLLEVARTAGALDDDAEASRLYRLALSTYWPIRRDQKSKDDFLTICASGLTVALSRLGLPPTEATIEELKASDESGFNWWLAPRLFVSGHYAKALTLLEAKDSHAESSMSALGWKYLCQASLCNLDEVDVIRRQWWKLRASELSLLSEDIYMWLNFMFAHSGALLASREDQQALELLTEAIGLAKNVQSTRAEKLRVVLSVRSSLARLRQMQTSGEEPKPGYSRVLAAEVLSEIEGYVRLVTREMTGTCDRKFKNSLMREPGQAEGVPRIYDGGGLFSGFEAPSPFRQKLAELLVEYAEILFYAGETNKIVLVAAHIEESILDGFDEASIGFLHQNRIAFCYSKAAILAIRGTTVQNTETKRELHLSAIRHRDADLEANQAGHRRLYYDRLFEVCGVQ